MLFTSFVSQAKIKTATLEFFENFYNFPKVKETKPQNLA